MASPFFAPTTTSIFWPGVFPPGAAPEDGDSDACDDEAAAVAMLARIVAVRPPTLAYRARVAQASHPPPEARAAVERARAMALRTRLMLQLFELPAWHAFRTELRASKARIVRAF